MAPCASYELDSGTGRQRIRSGGTPSRGIRASPPTRSTTGSVCSSSTHSPCRARSRLGRRIERRRSSSRRRGTSRLRGLVERLGVPVYTPLPDTAEYLMQKYGITAEQAGDGSPDVVWLLKEGIGEAHPYEAGDRLDVGVQAFPDRSRTTWCSGSRAMARSSWATAPRLRRRAPDQSAMAGPGHDARASRRGAAPVARPARGARARDARRPVRPGDTRARAGVPVRRLRPGAAARPYSGQRRRERDPCRAFSSIFVAFAEVDRPPRVALQARVEEARGIFQRRALGEGHLHGALVGLAGADDPVVRPHGNAPGLDGFLHFTSSTTSGSASLISVRSRASISPRQSSSSAILASINSDGDPELCGASFFTTSV